MAKRKNMKTTAVEMPLTKDEAIHILTEIGKLQRQVAYVETVMNDKLAEVKEQAEIEVKPLNSEIDTLFQRLYMWAEANREVICKKGQKTAKLSSGVLSWRYTPPSVTVRNQAKVIEILKARGLHDAIRSKETVNKDYILANPGDFNDIEGITISNREEFVVKPAETEIEKAEVVSAKAA